MRSYSQLNRLILRDLNKDPYIRRNNPLHFMCKYPKDMVARWIHHPELHQDELRRMSRHLYLVSPHYKRLINYFATMHLFSYIVVPYKLKPEVVMDDKDKYTESYFKALNYLDKMNIRHEMSKIFKICFKEDVFYGYIYESQDSFYIRTLPPEYCRISCIEDGCFLYDFDFTYFLKYPMDLERFGEEFVERFNLFKEQGVRWQTLDAKREFCIKLLDEVPFPVVPFLGVFEGIYDIDDYKSLRKAKAETDNYKVIALKVPTDNEGHFLIDRDILLEYYSALLDVLPENIGAFLTPMDTKDFDFENAGTAENNNVNNAIKTFWNDAGVSSLIFGDENKTSQTLNVSIKADMQMVFDLARQVERNINRLLKMRSGKYKFKMQFIDATQYNKDDMFKMCLNGSQSSLPMTTMACATMGVEPLDMMGINFLENDILHLPERFTALSTSFTKSSDDKQGKTKDESELSDAGELTRESEVGNEY